MGLEAPRRQFASSDEITRGLLSLIRYPLGTGHTASEPNVNTWTQSLSSYRWSQAEHDELVRWPRFPETLFVRLRSLEA